jgi:Holliday junction resolvase RusA-like endonuclease
MVTIDAVKMVKSRAYRKWLDVACVLLRTKLNRVRSYPIAITVHVVQGSGMNRGRDLDNFIKPTLDAMRAAQVLAGDNLTRIDRLTLVYVPKDWAGAASVVITIEEPECSNVTPSTTPSSRPRKTTRRGWSTPTGSTSTAEPTGPSSSGSK